MRQMSHQAADLSAAKKSMLSLTRKTKKPGPVSPGPCRRCADGYTQPRSFIASATRCTATR